MGGAVWFVSAAAPALADTATQDDASPWKISIGLG